MREYRIIQVGLLILTITVALALGRPLFADPPLPLPKLPICGDEDEYNVVEQCNELTVLKDVQLYRVPGTSTVDVTYDFVFKAAYLANELGFFYVDDQAGRVDGLLPGQAGYTAAALNRANVIFTSGSNAFTPNKTISMDSGRLMVFYMIQNDTTANMLANNPINLTTGTPVAYFSLDRLNPNVNLDQFVAFENTQNAYSEFGFEDEHVSSDWDYDDVVYTVMPPPIPVLIDSDGDGLPDDWEINGVDTDLNGTPDLDLAAAGADPAQKDIFVWIDWLVGSGHASHRPSDEAINLVKAAYANQGIQLHVKFGSAIPENAANQELIDFALATGSGNLTLNTNDWKNVRQQYFLNNNSNPGRASVYHYALFGHDVGRQPIVCPFRGSVTPAGWSHKNDVVIGLNRALENGKLTPVLEGLVLMHELGHTLGLGHGGVYPDNQRWNPEVTDFKPNHLSIMNQAFSNWDQPGLTIDGLSGVLDYSIFGPGDIPALDENGLNETIGLNSTNPDVSKYGTWRFCSKDDTVGTFVANANGPIDWNCDGDGADQSVKVNINKSTVVGLTCASTYNESGLLATSNEWEKLDFVHGTVGLFSNILPPFPSQVVFAESTLELPMDYSIDPFVMYLPAITRSNSK